MMYHYMRSALAALSAVVCTEVGDNTFFVAVILSMTSPRAAVFAGALLANAIMHTISVSLGYVASFIPHALTYWISTILLTVIGIKMISDGLRMSANKTDREYKEAQEDISKHKKSDSAVSRLVQIFLSPAFVEAFALTFVGEWGDRSQVSTVLMAAQSEVSAVLLGGISGHAICLVLATFGGSIISKKVSVRAMTLLGGVVFIIFAVTALLDHQ